MTQRWEGLPGITGAGSFAPAHLLVMANGVSGYSVSVMAQESAHFGIPQLLPGCWGPPLMEGVTCYLCVPRLVPSPQPSVQTRVVERSQLSGAVDWV